MNKLMPRKLVPDLKAKTLSGSTWDIRDAHPEHFTMVVFYRGLHCPICKTYMGELNKLAGDFANRGIDVAAISSDTLARARQTQEEWGLADLDLGCGLDLGNARNWGLYISSGRGKSSLGIEEPAQFSEPGVFLVRPDGTLYWASVQSMPFARPHFREILGALDFVIKNDYPARGEA